jgi:hypothetical protein
MRLTTGPRLCSVHDISEFDLQIIREYLEQIVESVANEAHRMIIGEFLSLVNGHVSDTEPSEAPFKIKGLK